MVLLAGGAPRPLSTLDLSLHMCRKVEGAGFWRRSGQMRGVARGVRWRRAEAEEAAEDRPVDWCSVGSLPMSKQFSFSRENPSFNQVEWE